MISMSAKKTMIISMGALIDLQVKDSMHLNEKL